MNKIEINHKLKPLATDLKNIGIGRYLKTTDFERVCIMVGVENLWYQIYEDVKNECEDCSLATDYKEQNSEDTIIRIINILYDKNRVGLNFFLGTVLEAYINWSDSELFLEPIIEDLGLIEFPEETIQSLTQLFDAKKGSWKKQIQTVEDFSKIAKILIVNYPIDELKFNKKRWIELLAKSKLGNVIDEIIAFSELVEEHQEQIKEKVVPIARRLVELEKRDNQGVLSYESYCIEKNRINSALIDLISNFTSNG
jgi:hypothetical protein